jgi:hypothetical protein
MRWLALARRQASAVVAGMRSRRVPTARLTAVPAAIQRQITNSADTAYYGRQTVITPDEAL